MRRLTGRLVPLALTATGLLIVGCGGDDSGQATAPSISIPAVTAPTISTFAQPTTTTTATAKGGSKSFKGSKSFNGAQTFRPGAPDSPTNDFPPVPGSPQEAFEKQCQKHPAFCR